MTYLNISFCKNNPLDHRFESKGRTGFDWIAEIKGFKAETVQSWEPSSAERGNMDLLYPCDLGTKMFWLWPDIRLQVLFVTF